MKSNMVYLSSQINKLIGTCPGEYASPDGINLNSFVPIYSDITNNINLSLNLLYENMPVFDLSENSSLYTYFNKINTSLIMLTDGGMYDTKNFFVLFNPTCPWGGMSLTSKGISGVTMTTMDLSNTLQGIKAANKNVIIINNFEDSNCVKEWTDTTTCDPSGYLLQTAVITQERQFCDLDATSRVGTTTC